jgi:choline dehydrogenase
VRTDDPELFPEGALAGEDETSGPAAPDLEIFVSPLGYISNGLVDSPLEDSLGLHVTLLRLIFYLHIPSF